MKWKQRLEQIFGFCLFWYVSSIWFLSDTFRKSHTSVICLMFSCCFIMIFFVIFFFVAIKWLFILNCECMTTDGQFVLVPYYILLNDKFLWHLSSAFWWFFCAFWWRRSSLITIVLNEICQDDLTRKKGKEIYIPPWMKNVRKNNIDNQKSSELFLESTRAIWQFGNFPIIINNLRLIKAWNQKAQWFFWQIILFMNLTVFEKEI